MLNALIDKLCERLAVEEGGVRIYQAILDKLGGDEDVVSRLRRFQADEAQHREVLARYLDQLGVAGDARVTPSALLARHEGEAYLRLIEEAETPAQLLNILLTVELTDENAWELLINLGRDRGDDEMVAAFAECLRHEKDHLMKVRGMVAQRVRSEIEAPEIASKV
jgi:rubrerythrin